MEKHRGPSPPELKDNFDTARVENLHSLRFQRGRPLTCTTFFETWCGEFTGITAPGMEPLYVPLVPSFPLEKVEKVTCWEWSGPALSEGADADEWFSNYVGKPTRLVRFDTGMECFYFFS
jgi:uncharacterized protein YcbX